MGEKMNHRQLRKKKKTIYLKSFSLIIIWWSDQLMRLTPLSPLGVASGSSAWRCCGCVLWIRWPQTVKCIIQYYLGNNAHIVHMKPSECSLNVRLNRLRCLMHSIWDTQLKHIVDIADSAVIKYPPLVKCSTFSVFMLSCCDSRQFESGVHVLC